MLGVSIVNDFYGLCYGDVNASYTPPLSKQSSSVSLLSRNIIDVIENQIIDIPIKVEEPINVAAISLDIIYPTEMIHIKDVSLGKNSNNKVLFSVNDGILRISWYSLESKQFNSDDIS